jgi:Fe2+ transport system protein B
MPRLRSLSLGLLERTKIFMHRVGGIILSLTVLLWALSSWPAPPVGASGAAINYSLAGQLGHALEHVFAPQCVSTLAVIRRETNSWRVVALSAGYLFALAYLAAFLTYRLALLFSS